MSRTKQQVVERAVEMLRIASQVLADLDPATASKLVFYDGTDCDAWCVADDCDTIAGELADTLSQA